MDVNKIIEQMQEYNDILYPFAPFGDYKSRKNYFENELKDKK